MSRKRYFGISTNKHRRPVAWRKFSIRFLFVLTAAVALGLGYWRANTYRHPAHAFPLYEQAPYTSGHTLKVGPNEVAIRSIARNRHDGSVDVVQGAGLSGAIPRVKQLKKCAKWLDVVQLELTPGSELVEIVEVRVFDHKTRTILGNQDYGWQVFEPNVLQIYGLYQEVPEKIDVWLRVQSHHDRDVYTLPPQAGAEVKLPDGVVSVDEVHGHYTGWSSQSGFVLRPGLSTDTGLLLNWQGDWKPEQRFQIAAINKDGYKEHYDRYLTFGPHGYQSPIRFQTSLEDLDHLELRSDGGRHAFFFDGLRVPPPAKRPFDRLPPLTIDVKQQEVEGVLTQYSPLKMRYRVRKGNEYADMGSSVHGQSVTGWPEDEAFSFYLMTYGHSGLRLDDKVLANVEGKDAYAELRSASHSNTAPSHKGTKLEKVYWRSLNGVEQIKLIPQRP